MGSRRHTRNLFAPACLAALAASAACNDRGPDRPPPSVPTSRPAAPASVAPQSSSTATAAGPRARPTEPAEAANLGVLPIGLGIPRGEPAPNAVLASAEGSPVELRDLFAKGPTLLVFYRGGWCPFCNSQIRELTSAAHELERRGIQPVAVSVDRLEESARTRATYRIPFPVLSDPDLTAHRAYHVLQHVSDAEVSRLKSFGMDLEQASGRDHHTIAVPSIFIVDRRGVIRWGHADPNYKRRPSMAQLLSVLDRLHLEANDRPQP